MKNKAVKRGGFKSDNIIGNHSSCTHQLLYKCDATGIIETDDTGYILDGKLIRSIDVGRKGVSIRASYGYGNFRAKSSKLNDGKPYHVINIDMVVHLEDKVWTTPLYYYNGTSRKAVLKECKEWFSSVGVVIEANKEQTKQVMAWVDEAERIHIDELHKKASSLVVDDALTKLKGAGCINVRLGHYIVPTEKGSKLLHDRSSKP